MLLQVGQHTIAETILEGMKAKHLTLPRTELAFRRNYQAYLNAMQPHCVWLREEPAGPLPITCSEELRRALVAVFHDESSRLDDLQQATIIKRQAEDARAEGMIQRGLDRLALRSPGHRELIDLTIERIFCEGSDRASGGSTSSAVGVIWANPHPRFSDDDLAEFLVHELTHNLMFLDEWVHPHYDYEKIVHEDTWCESAILQKKRPIDKVVHSIVVAAEVVLLRNSCLGEPVDPCAHPPTAEIVRAVERSISELRAIPDVESFVYHRVWTILENIERLLRDRDRAREFRNAS